MTYLFVGCAIYWWIRLHDSGIGQHGSRLIIAMTMTVCALVAAARDVRRARDRERIWWDD